MATDKYGLPKYLKGKSFSEAAAELNDRFSERLDPISQKTYSTLMGRLKDYQEATRAEMGLTDPQAEGQPQEYKWGSTVDPIWDPTQVSDGEVYYNDRDVSSVIDPAFQSRGLDLMGMGASQRQALSNLDMGLNANGTPSSLNINDTIPTETATTSGSGGNGLMGGLGTAARMAPIAANLFNMFNTKKPGVPNRPQLEGSYTPEKMNTGRLEQGLGAGMATANQSLLEQSNGNFGEFASQVGNVQSNYNKALSDAMLGVERMNISEANSAQKYNIGRDDKQVLMDKQFDDERLMDTAAYEAQQSQNISDLASNIGGLGTEAFNRSQVDKLYGDEGSMKQLYALMNMLNKNNKVKE